ncbi:hypothetical protein BKA80DRAFT_313179 [Phyllosticta citrichinensis]
MLFRLLAQQESHYAYADVCIHPHAAGSTTMSTQSEVQHKRAHEEEDRQGGSSKAQEGASTSSMGSDAPTTSTTSDASGVNMITGDGSGKKAAAMAGPARMIGPQFKFALVSLFAALAIAAPGIKDDSAAAMEKRDCANPVESCSTNADCCSGYCHYESLFGNICG